MRLVTHSDSPPVVRATLLTVEEAADYLNVKPRFVRRLIAERRVDFLKLGRLVRLRSQDLDNLVAGSRVPAIRDALGERP